MESQFLDAFIHLEKICGEMYESNHGISMYIEDMENTTQSIQNRIPEWVATYKKLKSIRWKRNQFVHEGNIEFDDTDVAWLRNFYRQIINGKDPLSKKYRMQRVANYNVIVDITDNTDLYESKVESDKKNETPILGAFLTGIAIVVVIVLVIGICMRLI